MPGAAGGCGSRLPLLLLKLASGTRLRTAIVVAAAVLGRARGFNPPAVGSFQNRLLASASMGEGRGVDGAAAAAAVTAEALAAAAAAGKKPQDLTLVFCRRSTPNGAEILLGMKKRGFGMGRWNGFGGKLEPGETVEAAAKRELIEESGVTATELSKRGDLTFILDSYEHIMRVHVFEAVQWHGSPHETDEMKPQWYREDALPLDRMWADDAHWMPLFLAGKRFRGEFLFQPDSVTIDTHWLREL